MAAHYILNPLFYMAKHKPLCLVMTLLVIVGGLNWGLVGLGSFLGMNLNVVNLILGSIPTLENVVYLLVGASAVASAVMLSSCKECACENK